MITAPFPASTDGESKRRATRRVVGSRLKRLIMQNGWRRQSTKCRSFHPCGALQYFQNSQDDKSNLDVLSPDHHPQTEPAQQEMWMGEQVGMVLLV